MRSNTTRLDRFISAKLRIKRSDVRLLLAQKRVLVDGVVATNIGQVIGPFSWVSFDDEVLQNQVARYLMMNKPLGVVSATKDSRNKTVIDLLPENERAGLHIPGRLDFNTTGLLLLTNDGQWSRNLSSPANNIAKVYTVTVSKPLDASYIDAFASGMFFNYEGITTRPVKLEILADYVAKLSLVEGRYHQIKRMFGRFQNEVLALHRDAIGGLSLDPSLASGQSRPLTQHEVLSLKG
ncbi:Ribosomal small subunit pseudouridine synthase A [Zhongshania aliphaticivorans]|uniref:Pseudouridine synthase n=1 Tax=Zhongshania aliphaticivorans TaxID=1470434 RepID=A0A5S9N902_9GAMM|nr:16S rRNA pseudouridine(516) synthase [Zhongshania aliphaticivorans]CAA0079558.1 Ribosomal small subunit pseudouridine synthase A [Zhongshania aliphaticivorans]CAA0086086.1 Ribosomal small subunit pseudouridine synthase A [Zhongshania aliphaticivorans]